MSHPLDSAREKLKRADENIVHLDHRIAAFLAPVPIVTFEAKGGVDPVFTDQDRKAFEELKEFIKNQDVEARFGVLAGEIIHHLRSAFDHLAWQLSSLDFQTKFPERIEFPVVKTPELCAIKKNEMCRYCRKIEGIASPTALARIESLQPHHGPDVTRHPLWLIHDLDRIDKHRQLALTVYIMQVNIAGEFRIPGVAKTMPFELMPRYVRPIGPPEVYVKGKMSAQITFSEFTGRKDESIVPLLQNLLRFTADAIESFAKEFA